MLAARQPAVVVCHYYHTLYSTSSTSFVQKHTLKRYVWSQCLLRCAIANGKANIFRVCTQALTPSPVLSLVFPLAPSFPLAPCFYALVITPTLSTMDAIVQLEALHSMMADGLLAADYYCSQCEVMLGSIVDDRTRTFQEKRSLLRDLRAAGKITSEQAQVYGQRLATALMESSSLVPPKSVCIPPAPLAIVAQSTAPPPSTTTVPTVPTVSIMMSVTMLNVLNAYSHAFHV